MTDFETLQQAKMYIDKMANGVNPLTDECISVDDFINNVNISRCLFFVSGVLDKILVNGGEIAPGPKSKTKKLPFSIESADLSRFNYSDTPVALSVIAGRINELIDTEVMQKVTYNMLATYMLAAGFLEEFTTPEGKTTKRPTDAGLKLGIEMVQKNGRDGNPYDVIVYNSDAQHFVIDNLYGNVG